MMIRMVLATAFVAGSIVMSGSAEAGGWRHRHRHYVPTVYAVQRPVLVHRVHRPVIAHHLHQPAVTVYRSYRVAPVVVPVYEAYYERPVLVYSAPYYY